MKQFYRSTSLGGITGHKTCKQKLCRPEMFFFITMWTIVTIKRKSNN